MSSLIIALNDFCAFEYIYKNDVNDEIIDTNRQKFLLIQNSYTGYKTLINDGRFQRHKTGNIQDNTGVVTDNGSVVYLDNDGRSYPEYDSNISVTQVAFSSLKYVTYETVRIHILSGYNFQDSLGFFLSIYCKTREEKPAYLSNLVYLKSASQNFYFNERPLKLSDKIYDKYIEIKIPSFKVMLDDQVSGGGTSFFEECFGTQMAEQNLFYCEFCSIESDDFSNGFRYMYLTEPRRFSVDSDNNFNQLGVDINEKENYFELKPNWDGESIENVIYSLNSIAGNKYILIHEIRVFEQYGSSFVQTSDISWIQTSDFDEPLDYRPVLKNKSGSAYAFSIDYTVRLFNQSDGKSIFTNGSITSVNSSKYSKKNLLINVGNTNEPFKVYNRIEKQNTSIIEQSGPLIRNKVVVYMVDRNTIQFYTPNSVNSITSRVANQIGFTPFVNVIRFDVTDENGGPRDISFFNNLSICIPKDSGSKIYIKEFQNENFSKVDGVIAFKFDSGVYDQIKSNVNTNSYYIINTSDNGEEVELYSGTYTIQS